MGRINRPKDWHGGNLYYSSVNVTEVVNESQLPLTSVVVTVYSPGAVPPLPLRFGVLVCQLDSAIPVALLDALVKLVFSGPVMFELTVTSETGPLLSVTVE